MKKNLAYFLLSAVTIFSFSACSVIGGGHRSNRLSDRRLVPPDVQAIEMQIERRALISALQDERLVRRLRVIEIFQSEAPSSSGYPQYRIFDVSDSSVYSLLGLKNGDILVAADDRFLANNRVFKDFIRLLPTVSEAEIEIRRKGRAILFKYKFI